MLLRAFLPPRAGADASATIVRRKDQDFLANFLAELKAAAGRERIQLADDRVDDKGQAGRPADGALKLFQPVHQVFNLVALEAVCDRPGQPRLDPRRIDSAGFVVRRVAGPRWEAWRTGADGRRGWMVVLGDGRDDPDFRRRSRLSAGHPELDRRLALQASFDDAAEQVAPLFVAPPDTCDAAGRTILYGVVPVTSSELSESGASVPVYGDEAQERADIRDHLSHYLKAGGEFALPRAGQTLAASWAREAGMAAEQALPENAGDTARLGHFVVLLHQLAVELDAFGDGAEGRALCVLLDELRLPAREVLRSRFEGGRTVERLEVVETVRAGDFLRQAARVLVSHESETGARMPLRWPAIEPAYAERVLAAVLAALSARFARLKPNIGRFERGDARYAVHAFIRLKRADGCAPRLIWAERPSEAFAIAPWYDSAGAAPARIELPHVDRDFLKRLKPNAAFTLPPSLMNMLNSNDPGALVDGDGKPGGSGGVGWICSFSIPILTLCAFIVLNIFLKLFDIIFNWMMYIKICIPYPKKGAD